MIPSFNPFLHGEYAGPNFTVNPNLLVSLSNFMFAHYVLNSCARSSLSDQMLGIHISYNCTLCENQFRDSLTLSYY